LVVRAPVMKRTTVTIQRRHPKMKKTTRPADRNLELQLLLDPPADPQQERSEPRNMRLRMTTRSNMGANKA
jgi:hypothetical protein